MSGTNVTSPKTAAGVRTVPVPSALWDELVTYLGDRVNEPEANVFPLVWRRFYQAYQAGVKAVFPLDEARWCSTHHPKLMANGARPLHRQGHL
jgi:hypothetical protein